MAGVGSRDLEAADIADESSIETIEAGIGPGGKPVWDKNDGVSKVATSDGPEGVLPAPVLGGLLAVGLGGAIHAYATRADASYVVAFSALAALSGYSLLSLTKQ